MPTAVHRLIRAVMRLYPFLGGQGHLVDSGPARARRFPEPTLRVRARRGFEMTVDPNDFIGRYVYYTGCALSDDVAGVLLSEARSGDRILDIGANVGYISCALLHGCPGCRVVAVEPQPECYDLLVSNLEPFGGRGKALRMAVSDRTGIGVLEVAHNRGRSHLLGDAPGEMEGRRILEVPLVTGEGLLAASGLDGVDLIKIDVEGHEETVLRTLAPVMARSRPRAVVFEHFGDPTAEGSPINSLFKALGYDLLAVRRGWFGWRLVPAAAFVRGGGKARDFVAVARVAAGPDVAGPHAEFEVVR